MASILDNPTEPQHDAPPVPVGADVEVFFDNDCPLCRREVDFLRRRDKQGKIAFTDIAAQDFRAADYGKSQDDLMAEIHGRLPDGTWIVGVEVFRRMYDAVGFGPVVSLTRLPIVRGMLDFAYAAFAKRRLKFTGRCNAGDCAVKA